MDNSFNGYLRGILGKRNFELCNKFFAELNNVEADYVALTPDCLTLARLLGAKTSRFCSLPILLASSDAIANYDKAAQATSIKLFPKIVIADLALAHDNTVSQFISTLTDRLARTLGVEPAGKPRFCRHFSTFLTFCTVMWDGLTPLPTCIRNINFSAQTITSIPEINQFLLNIDSAIAPYRLAPYLHIKTQTDYNKVCEWADAHMSYQLPYRNLFFERGWAYSVDGASVLTLQAVPCAADGTINFVPHFFFNNPNSATSTHKLTAILGAEARELFPKNWDCFEWLINEALLSVVQQNFLLLMRAEMDIDAELVTSKLEFQNPSRPYPFTTLLKARTKPWMPLQDTFLVLDKEVPQGGLPYENWGIVPSIEEMERLSTTLDDILYDYAKELAAHLHRQQKEREFWGTRVPALYTAAQVQKEVDRRLDVSFSPRATLLLLQRAAAQGLIEMRPLCGDGRALYVSGFTIRSQALRALPARYQDFIPILAIAEKQCLKSESLMVQKIQEMSQIPTKEVLDLLKDIYRIGQSFYEWDLNYAGWASIEWAPADSTMPTAQELEQRILNALYNTLDVQNNLLDAYMRLRKITYDTAT